jgi:hypothetical protein
MGFLHFRMGGNGCLWQMDFVVETRTGSGGLWPGKATQG